MKNKWVPWVLLLASLALNLALIGDVLQAWSEIRLTSQQHDAHHMKGAK